MRISEVSHYVGRTGLWSPPKVTIRIPVEVCDARWSFGRVQLEIWPIGGTGRQWVDEGTVRINDTQEA